MNIRGLQDFGRVAVVVDGARQNYQRSGHNANGAFFLDPELIGGIDIVRGPSGNIYGSGAIGGVVSFRTKDIEDVVRPGERWGVDVGGMGGSNKTRGFASTFGGIRLNPDNDLFGGFVYRNNSNYKDGSGTEIGNTNSEVTAGLLKLTTRPWEGHQIKFGGVVQNFDYTIGQQNRGPTTTAAPLAAIAGSSTYDSTVQNWTGTVNWRYNKPGDDLFDWNANVLRQSHREQPGQDLQQPHHHRLAASVRWACRATTSRAASATSVAIGSIRSAATPTTPRASPTATGATR